MSNGNKSHTYYVRDASGTVLSIYNAVDNTEKGVPTQSEIPVYGASRLGVYVSSGFSQEEGITGNYRYELTDHLGNVRAVIGKTSGRIPYVVARTDYYPFGMAMPGRNVEGSYRYGYQGQEKDPETGMEAFELRLWDSRIGRWLTVDPYGQFASPYLGMGNNPIKFIDPDGGMCVDSEGNNIPCPDGYEQFNGPTPQIFEVWGDGNVFELTAPTTYISSNGLNLNVAGFSSNQNIVMDHILGLEKGRPNMGKVNYIILHRTVSDNYPGGWMKSKDKIKGAHFYVDKDGTTYQTASLNISVAHIYASSSKQMYPDYYGILMNTNSIGIEVIGNYKDEKWEPLTQEQIEATSILVQQIKNHYNIHSDNIYPHEKVQRKTEGEGQTILDALNFN